MAAGLGDPHAVSPLFPGKRMQTQSTAHSRDGSQITFEVSGTGSPSLAFVHGWSCDRSYWDDQITEFSKTHRVISVDLAGHGRSSKDRTTWSIGEFARDVVAVLAATDATDVVVIGHSLGGPVAGEAALLALDRVRGVMGVECFFDLWREPVFSAVLDAVRGDPSGQTSAWVKGAMFHQDADQGLVERVASAMAAAPPEVAVPALAGLVDWAHERFIPALHALHVPFRLMMAGDPPYPTTLAARTVPSGSGFAVEAVPGVGHFLMIESPDRFNERLRSVLATM